MRIPKTTANAYRTICRVLKFNTMNILLFFNNLDKKYLARQRFPNRVDFPTIEQTALNFPLFGL